MVGWTGSGAVADSSSAPSAGVSSELLATAYVAVAATGGCVFLVSIGWAALPVLDVQQTPRARLQVFVP
jgi:hypothetical protein